jgi:hypothetical protein
MRRISGAAIPQVGATASGEISPASARTSSRPARCGESDRGSASSSSNSAWAERQQQQRVGPRADEVVLVGLAGGARAPRVDDDDLAAAGADRPQPPAHVGRREQAAVGGQGVGAEDEQVVGAIDVGHATVAPLPNISAEAICLGYWSTVLALNRLRVCRALSRTRP